MRQPKLDYSSNQYERPNQPWVCGLASEGQACPAGPTAGGRCPALAECMPMRDGDRWRCNRSVLRGGVCDEGPTPEGGCCRVHHCHPVRSLRSVRARFVAMCSLLLIGGMLVVLSANRRDEVLSSGPLALQHAQLTGHERSNSNCAVCHAAAERGPVGWTMAAFVRNGDRPSQPELCVKCHGKTIPKELALTAHTLSTEQLQQITHSRRRDNTSQKMRLDGVQQEPIACAACHREHRGAMADLTAIDNASCRACHQQRYRSFAEDHPDFGIWPYERRTRIMFDHASHQAKHFAEKKQTFDCLICHVEDAKQQAQLLVGYEAACASCHDSGIATSLAKGVPMIALPTLDVAAMRATELDIGEWPERATGDFDGRLPPVMRLLLAGDPAAAQAMDKMGIDCDFSDVDPSDKEQLQACATLAVAIKKLLSDLSEEGSEDVGERLKVAIGRAVPQAELDALTAGLSVDTIRPAASAWKLGEKLQSAENIDLQTSQTSTPSNDSSKLRAEPETPSFAPAGAWFRDDATFSIRYRPTGHADPVMASWLELVVATPHADELPVSRAALKEMSKPMAPGQCVSCHSIEQTTAGNLTINWRAEGSSSARTFTKFSHGPHLTLPQLADCAGCHTIDKNAKTAASYAHRDSHTFMSEFAPLSKKQCAVCHTASAAGDQCQSCHNYHVDKVEVWRSVRDRSAMKTDQERIESVRSTLREAGAAF